MAAKRLVAFLGVLLVVALIASAVAPREEDPATETTPRPTSTAGAGAGAADARGRTVTRTVAAGSDSKTVVRVRAGDLLRLAVESSRPGVVTIDALDRIESVDATTPARFEFVAERTGTFPVRVRGADQSEAEAGTVVARVEVAAAA